MKSCNSCKYQPGCAGWHCSCEKDSKEDYSCDGYTPEGWISVKDKLPTEMEYVLVDDLGINNTVTHWMPLPNQPEID